MGLLEEQGVVVTGAAGGIGQALARRAAAEGARVVVNDLELEAIAGFAAEIGATPIAGDAASWNGVEMLIESARDALGEIDVFFANAGIEKGVGLEATEAEWANALNVNVMAHVRAARRLVPRWIELGGGRFVVTASAAGLLTMIGNPTYAVSKHGAVAFAEWLDITYRHQGIHVHAICPQGVRTRMYEEAGPLKDLLAHDTVIEPEQVADAAFAAIAEDRFLVLPHPEVEGYYAARATQTERWLRGMNKIQRGVEQMGIAP
jgi:NAD(P)-dependent dehydrogenase (short-subunit alcohol dehydrogenase family)